MSTGKKVTKCIRVAEYEFPLVGLQSKHAVTPEGIVVAKDDKCTKLEARHNPGKVVDFSDHSLYLFLRELARKGVGVMETYGGVEYEFLDTN